MWAAFSFERVTVLGSTALDEWQRLRAAGRGVPVVIGGDEALERIADQFSMDDPAVAGVALPGVPPPRAPAAILADAARLRRPVDLAKWNGAYRPEDLTAPEGTWPTLTSADLPNLSVATDLTKNRPLDRVHLLLLPATESWQVPAYLRWGGWNACPPPEYHVAALRSWHGRYGVELVGIDGDTMNLRAARQPSSRAEALALAREQYRYCPDIVDQGVGSLNALAATLMATDWWFLWWD